MNHKKENYMSNFSLKLYNICQKYPIFRSFKVILYFVDAVLLLFIRKPKKVEQKKKEIFVMYNYAFGDGVIFLCSFRHIRELYPNSDYNITFICQKGLQSIYEDANIFDEVIPFNLTGATFNLKERFKLFKILRSKRYDIVLDPIGANECTTNVFMSRALCSYEKITILDKTISKQLCPKWLYKKIYTKIIEVNTPNLSLIEFYSEFLRGLGLNEFKVKLEPFKSRKIDIKLPEKYYIVFPSASTLLKRWPVERYAAIVKKIYEKTKMPILFCGTKSDLASIEELKELIADIPYYDIVGQTNLLDFIEVIKRAQFVITNDTSTYHIAVVNEVPVAIITGGYTYDRYVSYEFEGNNNFRKPYIIVNKMPCFNCDNRCVKLSTGNGLWPCLNDITVDYAWSIIEKMIDKEVK
ncbi:MAG: glycosyltransferase family 9 protein [Bacilli bacterium]|nr:glycosyltransferase family 9 protein [Bacilli bacterium]